MSRGRGSGVAGRRLHENASYFTRPSGIICGRGGGRVRRGGRGGVRGRAARGGETHRDLAHLQLVGVLGDRRHDRVVGRDEDEAAHADLVDALLREVVGRVAPVDARRVVSMRFDWGGLRAKSAAYGNFWANS